ncbi:LuxR C-terminal-related transcriptional regulator [Kitasatospora sp. NPDC052896]|uniref:helix-turn-helix transcriptional regulator n=1 Tax=Kitasatospora sp. NPDC052896 TaxID=3364061 RepID=UPI0037C8DD2B
MQEIDLDVYAWIGKHRSVDPEAVAKGTALAVQEATDSIGRLISARLVHTTPEDPAVGYAVAPETATAQLAAPIEERIREERQRLVGIREALVRYTQAYHRSSSPSSGGLEVLDNLQDVRAALTRAAANCAEEMLSCQPGGGSRVPAAMQEAIDRDREMLERGIRIRTLYHHTARFNVPSQAYVAAASVLGAQYRTAHELFGRLIVFDRERAFIPVQDGSWGAVVISEPSTVGYLCEIFEQTWERATPFADAASQGLGQVSREIHETIIRLLAAGLKDETIARRLGMSLRTARRHIADIMEQLNATSRFQAGVAAAVGGLLDGDDPLPADGPGNVNT